MTDRKKPGKHEALQKMQRLCSMREKCRHDVLEKLRGSGFSTEDAEWVVIKLEEDRFIDDTRYAGFFTRDKYKFNHWGRLKIRHALQVKNIEKDIIEDALSAIDEEEYISVMEGEAIKKNRTVKEEDSYRRKVKLMQFLAGRGVEPNYVYEIVDKILGG